MSLQFIKIKREIVLPIIFYMNGRNDIQKSVNLCLTTIFQLKIAKLFY